jgi:ABC-type sugar transport system ATPase subunit
VSELLRARGICKSFANVPVLKEVSLDVRAGEVHALVGENGAGKSTLMNILAGVLQPDVGELTFLGETRRGFASAHEAQQRGIAIVFQERSLFAPLTVAENIFAGRQPVRGWGHIDRRRLREDADKWLRQVAPEVSPGDIVDELSPAQQQMVEIAKALSLRARLMIFDEPTAALTQAETDRLFSSIRELKKRGVGIIYISHRLEEVFALAERVTVLKDGVGRGTLPVAQTSPEELIRLMVGRELERLSVTAAGTIGPALLEVRNLSDPARMSESRSFLRDISLQARAGEVVGLAGLAGAGRTELALTLFGARVRGQGEVRVRGRAFRPASPAAAIAAGLGYLSEDRKESGLFLEMVLSRNIAAASLSRFGSWFYQDARERAETDSFRQKLRIVSQGPHQEVGRLSGGNQQKVLLARWLLVNPTVLIADEPTRGVDVGAKADLHQLLREFAGRGATVILISSDLPEILALSDRVYVMRAGRIAGELPRAEASEEAVMRLAALEKG